VHPGDKPGRHDEGGQLVLDEVGHDLDDGRLDAGVVVERRGPVDGGGGVPLAGQGLGVELGGDVGPDLVPPVEVGQAQGRAAVLDEGAPGGQPPGGRGAVDDPRRPGATGADGAAPAVVVRRAADDGERTPPVSVVPDRVAVGPAPGREVDRQVGVAAGDSERIARRQAGQGPFDEDVGAPVEAEVLKVDSRIQR
jgi:hypothetical protein